MTQLSIHKQQYSGGVVIPPVDQDPIPASTSPVSFGDSSREALSSAAPADTPVSTPRFHSAPTSSVLEEPTARTPDPSPTQIPTTLQAPETVANSSCSSPQVATPGLTVNVYGGVCKVFTNGTDLESDSTQSTTTQVDSSSFALFLRGLLAVSSRQELSDVQGKLTYLQDIVEAKRRLLEADDLLRDLHE